VRAPVDALRWALKHIGLPLPDGEVEADPWGIRSLLRRRPATLRALPFTMFGEAAAPRPYTLIETAKLNDVDPQAWLADVLARLQDHQAKRIAELLPWNWKRQRQYKLAA
jgi:hypothetical protein